VTLTNPRSRLLTMTEASLAVGCSAHVIRHQIKAHRLTRYLAYQGGARPHVRVQLGQLADLYPNAPGVQELLIRG
jgi:hypothetical protein